MFHRKSGVFSNNRTPAISQNIAASENVHDFIQSHLVYNILRSPAITRVSDPQIVHADPDPGFAIYADLVPGLDFFQKQVFST